MKNIQSTKNNISVDMLSRKDATDPSQVRKKYSQLKLQIENEKLKAMISTKLLKKTLQQKLISSNTNEKKEFNEKISNPETMFTNEDSNCKRIKIYNQPFLPPSEQNTGEQSCTLTPTNKTLSETLSTSSSSKYRGKLSIEDFKIGRMLGTGKFGEVILARHIQSGFICAIKRIKKKGLDRRLKNQLIREIRIQMFLNHPNIVKMYTFFADEECIYLVLQLCISGQLYELLKSKKRIEENLAKIILKQIVQGLDCIHEHQIIHRDLKPQNILYHNGMMKICDFGWSIDSHLMRQTFCGTPLYISPQLLKQKYYNNKVDIWGLGILSYQLLLGKVPFEIFNQNDFKKIVNDDLNLSQMVDLSTEAKDFIQRCLNKQPDERLTSSELLMHPFLKSVELATFSQIF